MTMYVGQNGVALERIKTNDDVYVDYAAFVESLLSLMLRICAINVCLLRLTLRNKSELHLNCINVLDASGMCVSTEQETMNGCVRACMYRYKGISTWLQCDFESQELMAFCLKNVLGLSKVKLIDAKFIWTEPHSKRIKVQLTIQQEVLNHATLEQPCLVVFIIRNLKCPECNKQYHNNMWRTQVQIRQKVWYWARTCMTYLQDLCIRLNISEPCFIWDSWS